MTEKPDLRAVVAAGVVGSEESFPSCEPTEMTDEKRHG